MKKFFLSTLLVLSAVASTQAQEEQEFTPIYKYRICLKDKKGTEFSVKHPEKFLSQKSIERRRKQKLKVNKTDLPVSQVYLNDIQATGVTILSTSKWNNTVLVQTTDTTLI
ncbi:MAG: serine protease, partial [Bacteroidaceae bacterium]|nr:serine protease [Bacteroidaceae bacterium]